MQNGTPRLFQHRMAQLSIQRHFPSARVVCGSCCGAGLPPFPNLLLRGLIETMIFSCKALAALTNGTSSNHSRLAPAATCRCLLQLQHGAASLARRIHTGSRSANSAAPTNVVSPADETERRLTRAADKTLILGAPHRTMLGRTEPAAVGPSKSTHTTPFLPLPPPTTLPERRERPDSPATMGPTGRGGWWAVTSNMGEVPPSSPWHGRRVKNLSGTRLLASKAPPVFVRLAFLPSPG